VTRRQFAAAAALRQAPPRRNILLIAVDDLNCDLGCYGHPLVRTPEIDAFARRALRFERAYCQYPVCNPSRTSLLSGYRPEATKILDNRENPRRHVTTKFLPEFLRSNGYYTARAGKIYHDGMDGAADWDLQSSPRGAPGVPTCEGRNLTNGKFAYFEWRASEAPDDDHPDGQTALEVESLLQAKRDKPFFIACGFRKPHDKYIAPKKYFDLYPPDTIPNAVGPADDPADIPLAAYPNRELRLGPAEGREFRRAYWACISFLDAQVGRVLRALAASPHANNTLVLFFSDHGLHLGEHDWWNKVALWERTTRVPMLLSVPGAKHHGAATRSIVELLDIYPTFAAWAGLRPPAGIEGRNLLPLVANPTTNWDRAANTVVVRGTGLGRTVRTDRYRYTEWPEGAELYDHDSDPNEFHNLANDPQYAARRAGLRKTLLSFNR